MTHPTPIAAQQLVQHTAKSCAASNAVYARGPVEMDGWRWRFEDSGELVPNCLVTIELVAPSSAARATLALHSGETEYPWWEYTNESRVLAWCAGHERLLAFLGRLLAGDPMIRAVETTDTRFQASIDGEALELGFRLFDERGVSRWRGLLIVEPDSIDQLPFSSIVDEQLPWLRVPARLAVEIDRAHASVADIKRIVAGSVVRMDGATNQALQTVMLRGPGLRLTARHEGLGRLVVTGSNG